MRKFIGLLVVLFIFLGTASYAQSGWFSGFMRSDGSEVIKGVKVYYQQVTCNGETILLMKIENTNNYDVELSWYNDFFSDAFQLIKREQNGNLQHIMTVPASTSIEGDCSNNTYPDLYIPIEAELGTDLSIFKYGRFSDFSIEKAS